MYINQSISCNECKGLCCGPVPVKKQELINIKKEIKKMPKKLREELENQQRDFGTCIFYDDINNRCGIQAVKPSICRAFGYYKNLICFQHPELASQKNWIVNEMPVGILSYDFTWKYFK